MVQTERSQGHRSGGGSWRGVRRRRRHTRWPKRVAVLSLGRLTAVSDDLPYPFSSVVIDDQMARRLRSARVGCCHDHRSNGVGVKAVVYDRYGAADVLRVADVPIPSPAAGQVRVKVVATSVNLSDWECLRGSPAYARIGGLRHPARRTLGSDIAGVVDDVGPGVTRFRPGDQVYGDNLALKGGFAEYALAPVSVLADKPAGLTFAEASTIPQAGAIALQGVRTAVAGSRVLINGAGGGSGTFAHPALCTSRRTRHRSRQRRQTGIHAVGGCGRRDRLRQGGLHAHHAAVRPDPRHGRAPFGVRLPTGTGAGWQIPVRGRVGGHAAPGAHRRSGGRATHRPIDRGARGETGPCALRVAGRYVRRRDGEDPHRPRLRARRHARRPRSCR